MHTFFQSIPPTEGVRKVGHGGRARSSISQSCILTWKAKGSETGYAFSICEQTSCARAKAFLCIATLLLRRFMSSPVQPTSSAS